jgi:hypothetical protein
MANGSPALRREAASGGASRSAPQTDRLAHLEATVASIQRTLDVQFKRMAAIQAELDVLAGEVRAALGKLSR